ncbi:hypothetical protein LCGC14_2699550, partial [marine sediment metagenome]
MYMKLLTTSVVSVSLLVGAHAALAAV